MDLPKDYVCADCGRRGCKLYRTAQSFNVHLQCFICSVERYDRNHPHFWGSDPEHFRNLDSIGWKVAAVPDGEGNYWGYSSVPEDRVRWWRALPLIVPKRGLLAAIRSWRIFS